MEQMQEVRVLVFQEEDVWLAQCVEYDICVRANDLLSLRTRFSHIFNLEQQECTRVGAKMSDCIGPAPSIYQDRWVKAWALNPVETGTEIGTMEPKYAICG